MNENNMDESVSSADAKVVVGPKSAFGMYAQVSFVAA